MSILRIGRTDSTTDGENVFIETGCLYCNVDTGGNHKWNCPITQREAEKREYARFTPPSDTPPVSQQQAWDEQHTIFVDFSDSLVYVEPVL